MTNQITLSIPKKIEGKDNFDRFDDKYVQTQKIRKIKKTSVISHVHRNVRCAL